MAFNEEHFSYRCQVNYYVYNDNIMYIKKFSDIQEAYMWMCSHANIRYPSDTNISIINNLECMSFIFMRDLLNMKLRYNDSFDIIPIYGSEVTYSIEYTNHDGIPLAQLIEPLAERTQPLEERTQRTQPLEERTQPLAERTQPLAERTQPLARSLLDNSNNIINAPNNQILNTYISIPQPSSASNTPNSSGWFIM